MERKILIVEDELSIQSILRELLIDAGYEVRTASTGTDAVAVFRSEAFDLVLLDIMIPGIDGFAVCRIIRQQSKTPVIMLTAMDEETAQVKAFELQADDYITKPFSIKLVLLRIEAVLRRTENRQCSADNDGILAYIGIRLNPVTMEVTADGKTVALTHIEYKLLKLFMEHPERVYTRDNLLNQIWGFDYFGDEKAVNIHIMNLRHKIGADYIEAIRGVGYRLAKNQ